MRADRFYLSASKSVCSFTFLNQTNCQNKKAQLQNFSDDFDSLFITIKKETSLFIAKPSMTNKQKKQNSPCVV